MKRTGFVSVLILGITLSASTVWCATVADVDAQTAVSDAWVIATREACVGFGHCNPYCAEVHVGKTDSAGQVPFFTTLGSSKEVRFYIYKRGYWFLGPNQGYYQLSSKRPYVPDNFLDDASERIRQLVSLTGATACPAAISLQRAPLSSLYKEMFGEAWSIARLPEQKEDAQKICSAIFFASLPNPELYVLARRDDSADPVFFERNQPECLEKLDFGDRDRFLRAVRSNDVAAVTEMLSRGVDPAIAARRVNPALVTATDADNLELMRALISFGANPNTRDSAARPLLIHVLSSPKRARPRALQLAEFLLVSGADPNLPDANGQSVFQRLAGTNQADAVALMLKHGASVSRTVSCNGCSDEGKAPIHFARYPEITRLLVASGADVNATYGQGTTALHDAYDLEIVRILVANGANVNAHGNGWTPLMHALQMYDANRSEVQRAAAFREMSRLLVEKGAMLDVKNYWGKETLDFTSDEALKAELRRLAQANR